MIVIGLTGGIGSGKSTVAARLAARGAALVDLDGIARQVAAPGGAAYEALVEHFGAAVVGQGGQLDRAAIAARAFADPAELAALNAITHPAIAAEACRRLDALDTPGRVVVVDIPLLDGGSRDRYRLTAVVVVDTPVESAIRRAVAARGLAEADVRARAAAQLTREERNALADVVVGNEGSLDELEAEIGPLWAWISELASVDSAGQEPGDADASCPR